MQTTSFFIKYCPPSVNHHRGYKVGKSGKAVHSFPMKSTTTFKNAFTQAIQEYKDRYNNPTPMNFKEKPPKIPETPYKGRVKVTLVFMFSDNKERDVDNYAKVPIDCLKGVFIADDRQIAKLVLVKRKVLFKDMAGTKFRIEEYNESEDDDNNN